MVNLGDRAYHVGLHNLLGGHLGYQVSMGPVKALPYLTAGKTRGVKSIDDARQLMEDWFAAIIRQSENATPQREKLKAGFEENFLTRSRLFQSLDNRVRERLARGIIETASPYIFRSSFAASLVDQIEKSDLVLFNGGAFAADHLDQYLPMVLFELYLAKKLGKKTAVVNQTVAVQRPSNTAMVSLVYSMLDGHLVREPRSKLVLEELGIDSNRVHVSCDAAFGLPLPQIKEHREKCERGQVGICVRGDRPVRAEFWAKVAGHLDEALKLDVKFFFTSRYQDKKAFDQIGRVNTGIDFLDFCDYPELIDRLQDFDFVITDRYHATIFSVLAGTPFITVDSNTFKTRGLMDMLDYPIDVMSDEDNFALMVDNIDRVIRESSSLRERLLSTRVRLSEFAKTSVEPLNALFSV